MSLMEQMLHRRSVRKYTGEAVTDEQLQQIINAGLSSASGKNTRPWEIVVVRDKEMLSKLAEARVGAGKMIGNADACMVVLGNTEASDTWIEDCSIVLANMHLMTDALGLGSCWVQGRGRMANNGETTDGYTRALIGYPSEYSLEAFLAIGVPATHPDAYTVDQLPAAKVHKEVF